MVTYLNRLALLGFNRSNVEHILEISKRQRKEPLVKEAHDYLDELSKTQPAVFKIYLSRDLEEGNKLASMDFSSENLKTLATFARNHAEELPFDDEFLNRLGSVVLGDSVEVSSSAAKILCSHTRSDRILRECCHELVRRLDYERADFLSALSALSVIAKRSPDIFEEISNDVTAYLLKEVVLQSRTKDRHQRGDSKGSMWEETEDAESQSKRLALRILCNRLISNHGSDSAAEIAKPVMDMLQTILDSHGDLSSDDSTR